MHPRKSLILGLAVILASAALIALTACEANKPTPPKVSTEPVAAGAARPGVPKATVLLVPEIQAEWSKSGHADIKAMAFNDWNDANPPAVPAACSRCHSTSGYQHYIGADGTPGGKADKDQPIGQTITCEACHNQATPKMTSVIFPSGAEIKGLGAEARCIQCHQGRSSTPTVNTIIKNAGVANDDTVSDKITFSNVHYFAAAATMYGTQVQGGYQYPDRMYDAKFAHVQGYNTCVGCHDVHSLEVKVDECKQCHTGVANKDDLKRIRNLGSMKDYNGNGDTKEGIAGEIDGLRTQLYTAVKAYAKEVSKKDIAYTADANPYWFIDTNGNGQVDKDEAVSTNRYNAFTARLAKAAYNYQVSVKDPGAFAHGGKYIIELLYDSTEDLNAKITAKVDQSKDVRSDAGHFASNTEPFRHWDNDPAAGGMVPAGCAKCHSAEGVKNFVRDGTNAAAPLPTSGFACTNCHDDTAKNTRYKVATVTFPSGAQINSGNNDTNLCMTCHQGRESKASVDKLIAGIALDAQSDKLRFLNVHYFAAGATLFGTEAKGAYEYTGKTYLGRFKHVQGKDSCVNCHQTHEQGVKVATCTDCHTTVKTVDDIATIRGPNSKGDYDGNGKEEGIGVELDNMRKATLAGIYSYGKDVVKSPLVYDGLAYPYWFADKDGDGKPDKDAKGVAVAFTNWTPRLLQAAYNYQYMSKDPGAEAHNGKYAIQILYDTLESLGQGGAQVQMTGKVRP
jgi:hypothetical protein